MKRGYGLLLILLALAVPVLAFDNFARIATVEPDTAKVGDTATAMGENLDKNVGELYVTDRKNDVKAKITSQTETEIQFTVPKIEAGRVSSDDSDGQQSFYDRTASDADD